jgi:hypothetical protein
VSGELFSVVMRILIESNGLKIASDSFGPNKQIGTYFGNSSRLNEVAAQRGTKYLKNLTGRS